MSDLEERLRTAVVRRSDEFEPSDDLPDRIGARVRHRRRVRRAATGGLVAVAAALVLVVSLVATDAYHEDSLWGTDSGDRVLTSPDEGVADTTAPDGSSATSTPTETTRATAPTVTFPRTTGSTAPATRPARPAVDILTTLNRAGYGPITAGMTVRQAQDAAHVTISVPAGSGCVEAHVDGLENEVDLVVEPSGGDPLDGVVRGATSVVSPIAEGGIAVGSSRSELLAALGQPTRTEDRTSLYGPGTELLVFESGGFAYGALMTDDFLMGLQSGDPAWLANADGCP
jgi:hypothetical protein